MLDHNIPQLKIPKGCNWDARAGFLVIQKDLKKLISFGTNHQFYYKNFNKVIANSKNMASLQKSFAG